MDIYSAVLIVGASVSAQWGGTPSVGDMIAARLAAPVLRYAYAGAKMHQVMPPDGALRDAALLVSVDGFYWYNGYKPDLEEARAALAHIFRVRGNKPTLLATVPRAVAINELIAAACAAHSACILVRLEGALEPTELHPGAAFQRKVLENAFPSWTRF